jgi:ABC-type nitrate/sulfonate/bicarbonate transport system permease component
MSTKAENPVGQLLLTNKSAIFVEAIVVLVVVWSLLAHGLGMEELISSPALVSVAIYELLLSGAWIEHFVASFRRIFLGFVFTMVVGVVVGIIMGVTEFWERVLEYYVLIGLALPSLFAAVFSAMWFGLTDITPMIAIGIVTVPFVSENIRGSVNDLEGDLIEMSSSFDVSRRRVLRRVLIQSIMPAIFGSARFAFSVAWKITTLTEVIISDVGVGSAIRIFMNQLSMTGVLKYVLLFTIIMLIVEYGIFRQIERRVFAWRQDFTMSFGGVSG